MGVTAARNVMVLTGADAGGRSNWTWEWNDQRQPPQRVSRDRDRIEALTKELESGLPGMLPDEEEIAETEIRHRLAAAPDGIRALAADLTDATELRQLAAAARAFSGPLADADREHDLARRLGAALLPAQLVATIRATDRVELRIDPTPATAHVPWGLLATGRGDERLVELCDVAYVAPHTDAAPTPERRRGRPLYIIDPKISVLDDDAFVLSDEQAADWRRLFRRRFRVDPGRDGPRAQRLTRQWLSDRLHARPRYVLFVGHITTEGPDRTPALHLDDRQSVYGRHPVRSSTSWRPFTADDALHGTLGAHEHIATLSDADKLAAYGTKRPSIPAVKGRPRHSEVDGRTLWPMAPTVALIACHSARDLGVEDPPGLLTAFFALGARRVIATRWTVLTDDVFSAAAGASAAPLHELARDVDRALWRNEPAVATVAALQRRALMRWRARPSLAECPLTWGALTVCVADQAPRDSPKKGRSAPSMP